jgi:hypothetical protein
VPLRKERLLTALAIIGLCAVTVSWGWSIVGFANARARAVESEHRADAVRHWTAIPGLAGDALEVSLTDAAEPTDIDAARKRGEALNAILSVRPLSSTNWLSLAGVRLVAGEGYDMVLGALAMSSLTGANEGSVMLQRGIFGLVQWEALPPDVRKRIIADLAGAVLETTVRDGEIAPAKSVLSVKTADTRREIANLLLAQGVSAKELARMGL